MMLIKIKSYKITDHSYFIKARYSNSGTWYIHNSVLMKAGTTVFSDRRIMKFEKFKWPALKVI